MNRSVRNKILILGLTFVLAFTMTIPAAAQGLITGDTIPEGMVYDHDAILIGENIVIDGTINGNAFILGNQVRVNGQVDGSLILIGQNASIGGTVTGEVYGVVLTLDLAPNASIGRDLYVATVSLTSGIASVIGRDLYAVGLDSGLNGQVGRDLHTVIGPIQLYNGLMTLLGYDNLTIKLHFETPLRSIAPSGDLLSPGRHAYEHSNTAILASPRSLQAESANAFDWSRWAINLLRNWVVLFVFCLLAFWLGRKGLKQSGQALQARPWRALGTGLLVLVISLASIGVALLLAVLIFAIGLGLNAIGVWQVAIALWIVAYACIGIVLAALWFFIAYGTKIIAIHFVGHWVFRKLFSQKNIWMDILALLAGSMVYSLLRSAPYVGWIFNVIVTAFGAGAAWLGYRAAVRKSLVMAAPVKEQEMIKPVEALQPVEPVQPVEVFSPVEPVPPEPIVVPAVPKPAKVASRKKSVPIEEQPIPKMPRKKVKPAQPAS